MKKNIKWETILSVVIIIVIISLALISLMKISEYDDNLNFEYDKINYISILEKNTITMIKKIDTSKIKENELIYIKKDTNSFQALTWTINETYKYINYLWENVSTWSYNWVFYTRQCLLEKDAIEWQIIKCSVKELIKN